MTSAHLNNMAFFLFVKKNAAPLIYWKASAVGRLQAEDDCLGVRL